jgi:2-polyprenyl-3-methyl-5-hydroxy-6-metoxy-1,4-benzoquinol methylase
MSNTVEVGGSDTASPLNVAKRLALIHKSVDLSGKRMLDAGCGAGEYVEALTKAGASAEGIEFVAEKVQSWQDKHPGDNRVRRGDLERLEFEDAQFDLVLLNEVLEHVPDDALALREIYRVLKPGGTLFLFSPNRYHPFQTHGVYSLKTGAHRGITKTFLLPWLPMAIGSRFFHYWSRNYWPAELARMVKEAGFRIETHSYVWQTFENNSGAHAEFSRRFAPIARKIANFSEKIPVVRRLGVSQLIIAVR